MSRLLISLSLQKNVFLSNQLMYEHNNTTSIIIHNTQSNPFITTSVSIAPRL